MAATKKRKIGDLGEGIVCRYLENKGFEVVDRNYLRPWGELDIVARKGSQFHFVEVKSVTREPGRGVGYRPEENMHAKKLQRLYRAIQTYMLQKRMGEEVLWQIDLACVYISLVDRKARVEIIENIML